MGNKLEKVKNFDDLIPSGEKEIISELEKKIKENKEKCPYLRKIGNFFYYCGKDLEENKIHEHEKPSPNNPLCKRRVNIPFLQLFCFFDYSACITYLGKHKY